MLGRAPGLCLLAAIVLAGCSRPETPRPEYRRLTRAICLDAVRQVRALPRPRSDAELLTVLRRLQAINRRMTERIALVDPPDGQRPELRQDAAVDIGIRTNATVRELIESLQASAQPRRELVRRRTTLRRAAVSDSHAWAKARMHACGDGPSRALADLAAGSV